MTHLENCFESARRNWIVVGLHVGHGSKRTVSPCEWKGLVIPVGVQVLLDRLGLFDLLNDGKDVVNAFDGGFGRIGLKFIPRP